MLRIRKVWRPSILFAALLVGNGPLRAAEPVRIGYQKSSTLVAVIRSQGSFEKALAAQGYELRWSEFSSGLPLTEALNVGGVDLSGDVADTVPVFAQAAGARLSYIAQEAPSPTAQAILVPNNSPVRSLADLRGKKVAVARAAGAHYLVIVALRNAGVALRDVTLAYLAPADGRAAFERGAVDAWAVWDPYVTAVRRQSDARVLADGTGQASYARYYLASSAFVGAHPKVVEAFYQALAEAGRWVRAQPDQAAALLAPIWGLDERIVRAANEHRSYSVRPVERSALGEQQRIADTFEAAGLLPKHIDTAAVEIWTPGVAPVRQEVSDAKH
jgi:sulfonate transport system substrate-binding protein